MKLNDTRKIKINWNGIEDNARITETDHDIIIEFETVEKANNILIITKDDLI